MLTLAVPDLLPSYPHFLYWITCYNISSLSHLIIVSSNWSIFCLFLFLVTNFQHLFCVNRRFCLMNIIGEWVKRSIAQLTSRGANFEILHRLQYFQDIISSYWFSVCSYKSCFEFHLCTHDTLIPILCGQYLVNIL